MGVDLDVLKASNQLRWSRATLTRNYTTVAQNLLKAKARYKVVEKRTGVPWPVVALIHLRESSQSWTASLAQGDPWDQISVHVPAGRGPFSSWEDAAIDALTKCPPFTAMNSDWSIGGALTAMEKYNGLGYAAKGVASPYLWSGTDQYVKGKYTSDHFYDPEFVDKQAGCAAILMRMMQLDPTITFTGVTISPTGKQLPKASTNWLSSVLSAIAAIFRRKT